MNSRFSTYFAWICLARRELMPPGWERSASVFKCDVDMSSDEYLPQQKPDDMFSSDITWHLRKTRRRPSSLKKTPWSQTFWYIDEPRWMKCKIKRSTWKSTRWIPGLNCFALCPGSVLLRKTQFSENLQVDGLPLRSLTTHSPLKVTGSPNRKSSNLYEVLWNLGISGVNSLFNFEGV